MDWSTEQQKEQRPISIVIVQIELDNIRPDMNRDECNEIRWTNILNEFKAACRALSSNLHEILSAEECGEECRELATRSAVNSWECLRTFY